MKAQNSLVCLLTDFGVKDTYVGVVKGILLAAVPSLQLVDLTHSIPPQDIRAAAFELMASVSEFPKNTMFISIVDPGVGSDRKILYAEGGGHRFMAPDNGLLSWVFKNKKPTKVIAIDPTFHGRDIFAPMAGRILKGEALSKMGKAVKTWEKLTFPQVKKIGSQWQGEILHVDGFGNLITNFLSKDLAPLRNSSKVWFDFGASDKPLTVRGLADSYSAVDKGKFLAIPGSAGFIEISVREGDASQSAGISRGAPVTVHFRI